METTKPVKVPPEYPQMYDTWDNYAMNHGGALDVQNSNTLDSFMSCGVTMLSGLRYSTPEEIVNKVLKERSVHDKKKIREAFVIFSDTDYTSAEGRGGNFLYKYIVENKLGKIMEFGPRMNPNTGNQIKVWVWEPPHKSLITNDRAMPVFGKILTRTHSGAAMYADDTRFQEHRAAAAAESRPAPEAVPQAQPVNIVPPNETRLERIARYRATGYSEAFLRDMFGAGV